MNEENMRKRRKRGGYIIYIYIYKFVNQLLQVIAR